MGYTTAGFWAPVNMLQKQFMQRRLWVHSSRFPGASEHAAEEM